jgi:hypothetical protein
VVVAPHKLYGPESNDLIFQLRSRGIDTVLLAGLVANLCVDSHLRALKENGFRVYVVKDAVAAPGEEAYRAALLNFGMIANGVLTTGEARRHGTLTGGRRSVCLVPARSRPLWRGRSWIGPGARGFLPALR